MSKKNIIITILVLIVIIASTILMLSFYKNNNHDKEIKKGGGNGIVVNDDKFNHDYDDLIYKKINDYYLLDINLQIVDSPDNWYFYKKELYQKFYTELESNHPETWTNLLDFKEKEEYNCLLFYSVDENSYILPKKCIHSLVEIDFNDTKKWIYQDSDNSLFISDNNITLDEELAVLKSENTDEYSGNSILYTDNSNSRFIVYNSFWREDFGYPSDLRVVSLNPVNVLEDKDPILNVYETNEISQEIRSLNPVNGENLKSDILTQMTYDIFSGSLIDVIAVNERNEVLMNFRSNVFSVVIWNLDDGTFKKYLDSKDLLNFSISKGTDFDVDSYIVDNFGYKCYDKFCLIERPDGYYFVNLNDSNFVIRKLNVERGSLDDRLSSAEHDIYYDQAEDLVILNGNLNESIALVDLD